MYNVIIVWAHYYVESNAVSCYTRMYPYCEVTVTVTLAHILMYHETETEYFGLIIPFDDINHVQTGGSA